MDSKAPKLCPGLKSVSMDIFKSGEKAVVWYAMRATYRRELMAKHLLDESGIENYIPMQQKITAQSGRKRKISVPAVHNLIFVHAAKDVIQTFKNRVPYLQYMMDRSRPEKISPIIVPDRDMENFMRVVQVCQEDLEFLPVGDRSFPAGARVRIVGGDLDGVEGVLSRSGKSKDRKLLVTLNGILSVKASVRPDSVVILDNDL